MQQARSSDQLAPLCFLIGTWHTTGKILPGLPGGGSEIQGTDSYAWIAGGRFILHRVDVVIGTSKSEAVEIIGYDEHQTRFFLTAYDNTGAITRMYAQVNGAGALELGNDKMRAVLTPNTDCLMTARWELFEESWKPWMELELRN